MQKANVSSLWKVSYPMMVSFFSSMMMMFIDRLFLAWYSPSSLNAAVKSGTLAWAIIIGWTTLTSISEIFVAQLNGAKKYDQIGVPVWQTIWITTASFLFFIPFALWIAPLIYDPVLKPEEFIYLQIFMLGGPAFSYISAISGFFIGRGLTKLIQWIAVLGNAINILLDPIFIFGIEGYFPAMGIKGAAIATVLATIIEAIVVFFLFIRKKHRDQFQVHKISINLDMLWRTIKIGASPAIFVCFEIAGWAIFYELMSTISDLHIFLSSVVQSIILPFMFFGMGLEKGSIALAGNLIGANEREKVDHVLKSGWKINFLFMLLSAVFLIAYPNYLIENFYTQESALQLGALASNTEIYAFIRYGLLCGLLYLFFENIRWVLNGILTAAGDTFFILSSGTISIWLFLLLPTYAFVVKSSGNLYIAFSIWIFYSVAATALMYFRFLWGKWRKKDILKNPELTSEESSSDSETADSLESTD